MNYSQYLSGWFLKEVPIILFCKGNQPFVNQSKLTLIRSTIGSVI